MFFGEQVMGEGRREAKFYAADGVAPPPQAGIPSVLFRAFVGVFAKDPMAQCSTFWVVASVLTQRGCGFFPRRTMKLNKVAMMFAVAALATAAGAQTRVTAARRPGHRLTGKRHRRTGLEEVAPMNCAGAMPTDARNGCRLRRRSGSRRGCTRPARSGSPGSRAASKVTFAADASSTSTSRPAGRPRQAGRLGLEDQGREPRSDHPVGHTDWIGTGRTTEAVGPPR